MKSAAFLSSLVALAVLFATNARYVYPDSQAELPELTPQHVVDPRFAGATFRFAGHATSVRSTRRGIVFIKLHDREEDLYLDVPVFPSLGCLPAKPARGDLVRVTGNLGSYGGIPQVRPLSAAHVAILQSSGNAALPLQQALARRNDTLDIGPVRAVAVEPFVSSRGLRHLRLTLADAAASGGTARTVQGVMFESDRSDCEATLLRSGEPVAVTAEVGTFRGRPSLTVRRVLGWE